MLNAKNMDALETLAGLAMPPNSRDMSAYNGKEFECICGSTHQFRSIFEYRNYVAAGANATMIVKCPNNSNYNTLITTKYKFIVVFKGFESLIGYMEE
jgi:hypothetical protein